MFRRRDPLGRRNPFLTLLYVILIIILFGCIYFLVSYTQEQREAYQDRKEQLIAQETGNFLGTTEEESVSVTEEASSVPQETLDKESQEESSTEVETEETVSESLETDKATEDESEEASKQEQQQTGSNHSQKTQDETPTRTSREESKETKSDDLQEAESKAAIPVSVGKYAASQLNILVLNGSGVSGMASEWAERLEKFGYVHVIYGSYKRGTTEVTKIFSADKEKAELMEKLFIEPDIEEGILEESDYAVDTDTMSEAEKKILDNVEVWIVIGSDDVQSN